MNRSRYLPPNGYPVGPYPSAYAPMPPTSAPMPNIMSTAGLALPPSAYANLNHPQSTLHQGQTSALWAANFSGAGGGPIIEDLCAPHPMHIGLPNAASPPLNALPPRMAMAAAMHPSSMPQIQNVYGIRQPLPPQYIPGAAPGGPGNNGNMMGGHPHQGLGASAGSPGMQAQLMRPYPGTPFPHHVATFAQQQQGGQQHQLDSGFPTPRPGHQGRMGQMGSPTPSNGASENSLDGFLSPNMGQ